MPFTRYNRSRVIFDLVGQPETDYDENVLLCVPRAAWLISRTFLKGYGLRRTNYAAGYQQGGYETPDDVQFDKIDDAISAYLGADDMCDGITAGLAGIQTAIENLTIAQASCCDGGSNGAGFADGPPAPFVDDGFSTYPPGFDDRAAYLAAKCKAANAVAGGWVKDLNWVLGTSIVGMLASAMVVAFFTPIPFDDLLVLAGVLVGLLIQGLMTSTVTTLRDFIVTNDEDIVCLLYSQLNAQDALDNVLAYFDSFFNGMMEYQIIRYLVNFDSMNSLLELNPTLQDSDITMGVSCDGCAGLPCGVGIITGQYNNQGFDANGYITVQINADPFNVSGCGLRYREYMQITPPSMIEVVGYTPSGIENGCVGAWRSSPLNNETSVWDVEGLPPIALPPFLVGSISMHAQVFGTITIKCAEAPPP